MAILIFQHYVTTANIVLAATSAMAYNLSSYNRNHLQAGCLYLGDYDASGSHKAVKLFQHYEKYLDKPELCRFHIMALDTITTAV